jgi:ribosomal protein S18 acetylase RimI-like enzyme
VDQNQKEPIEIISAQSDSDFAAGRLLFEEYAAALQVDLCFQSFAFELQRLPSMYGPPLGSLLLASLHNDLAGCVGIRQLRADVCEMKRLYVRPIFRGQHLGRRLAVEAARTARQIGYRTMVLDTLASMEAAQALYRSMGFEPTTAYYTNPLPDVTYLALDLS